MHAGEHFSAERGFGSAEGSTRRSCNMPVCSLVSPRFRLTAALVTLLLEAGLNIPHSVLNKFVRIFSDYNPTDANDWLRLERPFNHFNPGRTITRLDFSTLSEP
jgi:hypothetical protein